MKINFNTSNLSVILFYQLLCKQSLKYADDEDDDTEDEDENSNPGNDSTPDAAGFSFSSLQKARETETST